MTPAGGPRKACNDTGLRVYPTTHDSQTGINRPPVIPAVEIPQTRFPTRIAGRCGSAGGAFRPPAFILLHFRPHVSPLFFGENRPLKLVMELVRCSGFVHEILDASDLDGPARPRKSCLPQYPLQKRPKQGWLAVGGCFLTPAAKASHKPTQPVTQGVPPFLLQKKTYIP